MSTVPEKSTVLSHSGVEKATIKKEVRGLSPIPRVQRNDFCKINAKFNPK